MAAALADQVPQPDLQRLSVLPDPRLSVLPGVTFAVVLDPESLDAACGQLQKALQAATDAFLARISIKLADAIFGGFEQGMKRMEDEFDAVNDDVDESVTVLGVRRRAESPDPAQETGRDPETSAEGSGLPATDK